MPTDAVSLPKAWPNHVRSAILQVVSLAHFAIAYARGWTANAINPRARQASEIDRLGTQVAMLQEQTRIKDARMGAIRPQQQPHYSPALRMAILELKAARGHSPTCPGQLEGLAQEDGCGIDQTQHSGGR